MGLDKDFRFYARSLGRLLRDFWHQASMCGMKMQKAPLLLAHGDQIGEVPGEVVREGPILLW